MAKMKNIASLNEIKVGLDFGDKTIPVGRLAIRDQTVYFEYHTNFLDKSLNISPFRLSLSPGVQSFSPTLFEGLPGVFNDSLPDGWGRLLFDRLVRSQNLIPHQFTSLDRLAHIGHSGLGALIYEPDHSDEPSEELIDLDNLAGQTKEVMDGAAEDVLATLVNLNGSSAGARPKALIGVELDRHQIVHGKQNLPDNYEHWMVKFANSLDGSDAGAIEYVYSLMAKEAGMEMTPCHLFPASRGAGYFATKRFDRIQNRRLHMHTASGLLHSDFRIPALDYEDLLTLTESLTRDVREVEKMFHLAVFNVLSHNRDDHGKNFTFLMDQSGEWKLSPAYDLTFSSGPRGHQSTMVMGEGQNPSVQHLTKLGREASLGTTQIKEIIDQTKHALSQWNTLANNYGVGQTNIKLIKSRLQIG